ncbi:MAG: class I SAM-dependent methyltransferase [Chloroflexota bacterium]|nr:class I SAM-dependent methyltransferase [Chloroflexota bacterium]
MTNKLYSDLAAWWPLLSPPEEYADEAAFFEQILANADLPPRPSLLELGCGGGSNAFYLKKMFAEVTLTDISPQMLEVSRGLNPECEHQQADMRTVRLGREFDVVFIHDAIDYMLTLADLRLAMETAFVHCKPGGVALFVPDDVSETFQPSTEHGGNDGQGRSLRYLEWTYDMEAADTEYTTEYVYLLREGNAATQVEHDMHTCGLFPRAEWLQLLQDVGFQAEIIRDEYERDLFLARRLNR